MTIASEDSVLLTEDEVVAAAACVGRPWPSVMPSANDEGNLLTAISRGRRSLLVRGLLTADPQRRAVLEPMLAALAGAVCSATEVVGVLATDDALNPLDIAPALFHTGDRDSEDWITDIVFAGGVHRLGGSSRDWCLGLLRSTAESVLRRGLAVAAAAPDPDGARLCVLGEPGGGRALLVRQGYVVGVEGDERHETRSLDEALHWLGVPDVQTSGI